MNIFCFYNGTSTLRQLEREKLLFWLSSSQNHRSTSHLVNSRVASRNFPLTVLLSRSSRGTTFSDRGWIGARSVEKETQKRGDVGDRRQKRRGARGEYAFFLGPRRFLRRDATGRTSSASIRFDRWLEAFFPPAAFSFPPVVPSKRHRVDGPISDEKGKQSGGEWRWEARPSGNFRIAASRSEDPCSLSWKIVPRDDVFETRNEQLLLTRNRVDDDKGW